MTERYRCIMVFGAPGVGKGTQGKRLGERDGYVHLATGDMFRGLDEKSAWGQKFLEYSSRGDLVPDELTVELWQTHVKDLIAQGKYSPDREILLLDGIPRSVPQAEMLEALIEPLGIIHLAATKLDSMVARMKGRAEQEGRHDDADEQVIRRRFDVYERETAPVLRHYDPGLRRDIDAMGTIEEVADRVVEAVEPIYDAAFSGASGG